MSRVLEETPITFKGKIINVGLAVKKDGNDVLRSVSPSSAGSARSPVMVNTPPSDVTSSRQTNYSPPPQQIYSMPMLTTQVEMTSSTVNTQPLTIPQPTMHQPIPAPFHAPIQYPTVTTAMPYSMYEAPVYFYTVPSTSQYQQLNMHNFYTYTGQNVHNISTYHPNLQPMNYYPHFSTVY